MVTYQDLVAVGENIQDRIDFVRMAINKHKSSNLYYDAVLGDEYDRHRNRTIVSYQKLLYKVSGQAVPDNFSANYKLSSGFFNRFVIQQVQFLLGNGVTWQNSATADRLGDDFETRLQEIGKAALVGGVAFGFFNLDHLEVFDAMEFAPLYDEENGALMAGIRFWQVDSSRPLRATLYEVDGYTDFIWEHGKGSVLRDKRSYKHKIRYSDVDGVEIYDGGNYPAFPIVPMWGNPHHQSELIGIREQIDAYDLIKSGFANTVDEAAFVYWTIQNAGGMDDIDLARFVERMKTMHAAVVDDYGSTAQAQTVEAPYAAREALLDRLSKDLYRDYMALDTSEIASGAATATQIRAAYEPMNSKADQFEYCVIDFIRGILALAGIDDNPTFTRSMIINTQEEVMTVLSAAGMLDEDYVTTKVLTLLGDADKIEEVLRRKTADESDRLDMMEDDDEEGSGARADGQADRGDGAADSAGI